ncbi:MAG TPA: 2OG-Fe(II) oxygenase [Blastocatellia bacterium]|nr:2OG-Fe(II) oxygenase [Blastocatellia bacterium]
MSVNLDQYLNNFDKEALRKQWQVTNAKPYPFFQTDNFLTEDFARQCLADFPTYEEAQQQGRSFNAVNEKRKIQITDSSKFKPAVAKLNEVLASQEFLDALSYITGMPKLLADEKLVGGGIHETGPQGHLDVHVDFNYIKERDLHRRMNILVYFNEDWKDEWGGKVELWDENVKHLRGAFSPIFNRCVVFETNEISFHGVGAVTCPPDRMRKSFAAYYYTREAPAHWTGESHSTIFKARPDEYFKGAVLMPAENAKRWMKKTISGLKKAVKGS